MDYLLENATPYLVLGGLLLTMAAIAYAHTRSRAAFLAILGALVLTVLGVLVEDLIETPREEVQRTVRELLDRIEDDDLSGVLSMLAPDASEMRSDAEALMPQFEVRKAGASGEIEVTIDQSAEPHQATATFRFATNVRHVKTDIRAPYTDQVVIELQRQDDDWVISDYQTGHNWRQDAGRLMRPSPGI